MIEKRKTVYKELPVAQIELDDWQPRKEYGTPQEQEKLANSIKELGLEEALMVSQIEDDRYVLIDGHRRYLCVKELGWDRVICQIYPKMSDGEFEARRYVKQNIRKPWKPMEKANSLYRAKTKLGLKSNSELAGFFEISKTIVTNALQLRDQKVEYLELMQEYQLPNSYRDEFVRLRPKLRKIRNFEVHQIVKIIFEKINHKIIRSAKDFRKLGKVFMRATANELEIHQFLSNADATVNELDIKTVQSGFSLQLEQFLQAILNKKKNGIVYSSKEKEVIDEIKKVL